MNCSTLYGLFIISYIYSGIVGTFLLCRYYIRRKTKTIATHINVSGFTIFIILFSIILGYLPLLVYILLKIKNKGVQKWHQEN